MEGKIINPLTKREIAVGSTVYWKLVKKGIIQDQSQAQPPQYLAPKQQPVLQYAPPPPPQISRAYSGLRGQTPAPVVKQKLPPQQKISNLIKSSAAAYKKTMESADQQQFETEDELTQYIEHELLNNLRATGNKHLNKYL